MLLNDLILEAKLPEKLKHGSSRGHLGEFLLGGAIVAKFIKGESAIDASDVKQVLVKNAAGDLSSTHQGESANDVINFINVISNPKNIADAKEVDFTLNVMSEELVGVVKFANSDVYTAKLSKFFAKNGIPDTITVKAAGEEDQSGTKADIFVTYKQPDGSERVLRPISVKTDSLLVGQASPRTFEGIQALFADLGITLQPIPDYQEDVNKHVTNILQQVVQDLNSYTVSNNTEKEQQLIQNLGNFLNVHVGLRDNKLLVVNIGKGDFTSQKISKLMSNMPNVDLQSSFKTGGRPAVIVHRKGSPRDILFQIRYTYQAPRINSKGKQMPERHRMFVEVGSLFKELATVSVRDVEAGQV